MGRKRKPDEEKRTVQRSISLTEQENRDVINHIGPIPFSVYVRNLIARDLQQTPHYPGFNGMEWNVIQQGKVENIKK